MREISMKVLSSLNNFEFFQFEGNLKYFNDQTHSLTEMLFSHASPLYSSVATV